MLALIHTAVLESRWPHTTSECDCPASESCRPDNSMMYRSQVSSAARIIFSRLNDVQLGLTGWSTKFNLSGLRETLAQQRVTAHRWRHLVEVPHELQVAPHAAEALRLVRLQLPRHPSIPLLHLGTFTLARRWASYTEDHPVTQGQLDASDSTLLGSSWR